MQNSIRSSGLVLKAENDINISFIGQWIGESYRIRQLACKDEFY